MSSFPHTVLLKIDISERGGGGEGVFNIAIGIELVVELAVQGYKRSVLSTVSVAELSWGKCVVSLRGWTKFCSITKDDITISG